MNAILLYTHGIHVHGVFSPHSKVMLVAGPAVPP